MARIKKYGRGHRFISLVVLAAAAAVLVTYLILFIESDQPLTARRIFTLVTAVAANALVIVQMFLITMECNKRLREAGKTTGIVDTLVNRKHRKAAKAQQQGGSTQTKNKTVAKKR